MNDRPDELTDTDEALAPGAERPKLSEAQEREAVIAALLRHDAEKAEVEEIRVRLLERRQRIGALHIVLILLSIVALWFWTLPPTAFRVPASPVPSLAEEEASLQLVIYLQAQKVEQYRLQEGRTPRVIEDAGPVFQGVDYIRLTDRHFRIQGRTARVTASYSSSDPPGDLWAKIGSILDVAEIPR